jgi:hypothetical protein
VSSSKPRQAHNGLHVSTRNTAVRCPLRLAAPAAPQMTCLGPGRNFASDPVDDEQGDGGDGGESQRLSSGASESQLTDAQLNNGTLLLVCTPQYMQLMLSTIRNTDVCSPRCDSNSLVGRVTKRARRAKELLEASNSHTSNTNPLVRLRARGGV